MRPSAGLDRASTELQYGADLEGQGIGGWQDVADIGTDPAPIGAAYFGLGPIDFLGQIAA